MTEFVIVKEQLNFEPNENNEFIATLDCPVFGYNDNWPDILKVFSEGGKIFVWVKQEVGCSHFRKIKFRMVLAHHSFKMDNGWAYIASEKIKRNKRYIDTHIFIKWPNN